MEDSSQDFKNQTLSQFFHNLTLEQWRWLVAFYVASLTVAFGFGTWFSKADLTGRVQAVDDKLQICISQRDSVESSLRIAREQLETYEGIDTSSSFDREISFVKATALPRLGREATAILVARDSGGPRLRIDGVVGISASLGTPHSNQLSTEGIDYKQENGRFYVETRTGEVWGGKCLGSEDHDTISVHFFLESKSDVR